MSDQQAEQISDSAVDAEQVATQKTGPEAGHETAAQSAMSDAAVPTIDVLDAPKIAPDHEAPTADAPKSVASGLPKLSELGDKAPKFDAVVFDAPKSDARRVPGQLVLMPRREDFAKDEFVKDEFVKAEQPDPKLRTPYATLGKRGVSVTAMLALAMIAGALGGALATAGLIQASATPAPAPVVAAVATPDPVLTASVAKLHADIDRLKAGLEQTKQTGQNELVKTADRVEKLEKGQNELAAKVARPSEVAKLSEVVEKLRAQAAASVAHEATGSITPPTAQPAQAVAAVAPVPPVQPVAPRVQAAAAVADAPKPEASKPKIVDGWVLRNVGRGGALIEGRQGLYQVYAGDPVPGLGKVEGIRRQDGRWVVVTTGGLVVSR